MGCSDTSLSGSGVPEAQVFKGPRCLDAHGSVNCLYTYWWITFSVQTSFAMDTKVTLSFDQQVVVQAKAFAEANNISLSRLVEFMLS